MECFVGEAIISTKFFRGRPIFFRGSRPMFNGSLQRRMQLFYSVFKGKKKRYLLNQGGTDIKSNSPILISLVDAY